MTTRSTRNNQVPAYVDAPRRTRMSEIDKPFRFLDEDKKGWAIAFGTALAGFALSPLHKLRGLRRSGARRYRKGLGR